MAEYTVIGLMSGTSGDGADIACCRFMIDDNGWSYKLIAATTYDYPEDWKKRLSSVFHGSGNELAGLHAAFGRYLGQLVNRFKEEFSVSGVDFVSSHGHTIFHQPSAGFTTQIGDGAALSAESSEHVVCDFRSVDVAHGGQGAPLVPAGDRHLFGAYDYCLNLGGIANISFEQEGNRIAWDVCPCNLLLNHFASSKGLAYDEGGKLAATGHCSAKLLDALNAVPFYTQRPPKTLGRENTDNLFIPLTSKYDLPVEDILNTLCEHMAMQVGRAQKAEDGNSRPTMLLTGGGAFNDFLVDRIRKHSRAEVVVPDKEIIQFKEAIIFAFLGVLRWRGEPNCLASVTGARNDVSGGAIYIAAGK